MLLDLNTDSVRELVPSGYDPMYVETGHILYADLSGGLWALPFDAKRLEVLGGAGEDNIYTYNVALRTAPRRLTFEGINRWPVLSPDGTRVAFASERDGTDGTG